MPRDDQNIITQQPASLIRINPKTTIKSKNSFNCSLISCCNTEIQVPEEEIYGAIQQQYSSPITIEPKSLFECEDSCNCANFIKCCVTTKVSVSIQNREPINDETTALIQGND